VLYPATYFKAKNAKKGDFRPKMAITKNYLGVTSQKPKTLRKSTFVAQILKIIQFQKQVKGKMKGKTLRKSTFVAQILKIIQFQF
jgi:hypothetical protein